MTACQSSDIGQSRSNGNFPQDKAKPHPWEWARWNLSFPKPSVQSHDPCRNLEQGLELLSILWLLPRHKYRAPFCSRCSRKVPVVLNRNFTADPRKQAMVLLLIAFASFIVRTVLQLAASWYLIVIPLIPLIPHLWGQVLTRSALSISWQCCTNDGALPVLIARWKLPLLKISLCTYAQV